MRSSCIHNPKAPFTTHIKAATLTEFHPTGQLSSAMSAELPTDPKAIKKMEKAIAKEAQADEKEYQGALKELKHTEKSEAKASKVSRLGSF